MFKNLLSKVGWGELPSSFGFTVGEKVDLPFSWQWELHKGLKKSDGSAVSIFICGKKDLDTAQVTAAKNAVQMAKSLRHTHILRALDSIEVEGGFYLVTEQVLPLLLEGATENDGKEPAVWGLYQALDALGFLHQSGFAHGLFGPTSVFVTPKGDYRLGSFELCRKGADAAALITQRRRSGANVMGWPEPPTCLQDSGAPTIGIDLWGAALMMAYVFGSAKTGQRGVDFRADLARAGQDLPPELRKAFAELSKPGPLRGRNPITDLLQNPFFQQHAAVKAMSFLGSLHIRSSEEKDVFFDGLPGLLESVPHSMQTRQVLPELLEAQKFPGQEAAQVLPGILKIGVRLKDEEFREKVAPLVCSLFASPDRAVRFRLLTSLGDMINHLDENMINDKIFPECVNGFTDSNGPIREATVKALIHFVPRLRVKTVEGRVVKLLVKLLQDPEASIRTNAVICSGRISGHLPKACANQTLVTILGAGLKDPFGPCRSASMNTLLATTSLFTAEELANRMMPAVCQRLVDPDPSVCDTAFSILTSLQQHVRQLVDDRRAQQGVQAGLQDVGPPGVPDGAREGGGGWSSWALSTVGSVVGNKIMGSMGPAKSVENLSATASNSAPTSQPAVEARGMSLSGGASTTAPGHSPSVDVEDEEGETTATAAGDAWGGDGAWGDDDEDEGAGPAGPAATSASKPAPAASVAATPVPRAAPVVVRAAPVASKAVAKRAAAPKAAAKALSQEDDDFWKEFDM